MKCIQKNVCFSIELLIWFNKKKIMLRFGGRYTKGPYTKGGFTKFENQCSI